jgi:hypothetical protein
MSIAFFGIALLELRRGNPPARGHATNRTASIQIVALQARMASMPTIVGFNDACATETLELAL